MKEENFFCQVAIRRNAMKYETKSRHVISLILIRLFFRKSLVYFSKLHVSWIFLSEIFKQASLQVGLNNYECDY